MRGLFEDAWRPRVVAFTPLRACLPARLEEHDKGGLLHMSAGAMAPTSRTQAVKRRLSGPSVSAIIAAGYLWAEEKTRERRAETLELGRQTDSLAELALRASPDSRRHRDGRAGTGGTSSGERTRSQFGM